MGEAAARSLAAAGAMVVIVDRDQNKAEQVAGEIDDGSRGPDVTSEDEVSAAVAVATSLAPLRTCIHCAEIGWRNGH